MYVEPLRPSTRFYSRFSLPRGRSNRFGSQPCDYRHFHTSPLIACGLVAFATPSLLQVKLATELHSLARYSKRTMHRQSIAEASHYQYLVSESFHSLLWVLFSFPSRYSFAIGLLACLALEVDAPYLPASYPRGGTRLYPLPCLCQLRGCHSLRRSFPGNFAGLNGG